MAYINSTKTREIRNELKKQFPKKDGWKFSVKNEHHSLISITILEAPVRFHESEHISLNHYQSDSIQNSEIFDKIVDIANGRFLEPEEQNFDKSDIMTDYFHVGWYVRFQQGDWDKPFKLIS